MKLLVLGTLINKLGSFIVPYLSIVLRRELGLSPTQVAWLLFAYGTGSIVALLSGGQLTDRMGRRSTLLVSLFGSGLVAIGLGLAAPTLRVFVPLLVLFAFLSDLYRPASAAIISDLMPSSERVRGFAALRVAVNLGFAFGLVAGGLVADWSFRMLFFADGATTLAFGLIARHSLRETRPTAAPAASGLDPLPPPSSPFRDPVYVRLLLVTLCFSIVFFCHVTILPLTITVAAGYPARAFGLLVGANGLLIALFELPLVERLRRFRRLRVAALGMLASGLGFGLTGLWLHWAWLLVTVVLWTLGEILFSPQHMAFVSDWAPHEARGRYLGAMQATWGVAFALNPVLFLPVYAWLGPRLFWPLMIVASLPPALWLLSLDRDADRAELLRGRNDRAGPGRAQG